MSSRLVNRLRKNLKRKLWKRTRHVTLRIGGLSAKFRVRRGAANYPLTGSYMEWEQIAVFLDALRPDDVVYELGGHLGTWSVFLGLSTPQGDVHVFEPEPGNRAELIENLERNGLARVSVHPLAASDANGSSSFGVWPSLGDGRHSLLVVEQHKASIEVETVRLDDFAVREGVRPPTAIKIDVEGAEAAVVRGLERTLKARIPRVIFIEVHRVSGLEKGQMEMHRQLVQAGYTVARSWVRKGEDQHLYVVRE